MNNQIEEINEFKQRLDYVRTLGFDSVMAYDLAPPENPTPSQTRAIAVFKAYLKITDVFERIKLIEKVKDSLGIASPNKLSAEIEPEDVVKVPEVKDDVSHIELRYLSDEQQNERLAQILVDQRENERLESALKHAQRFGFDSIEAYQASLPKYQSLSESRANAAFKSYLKISDIAERRKLLDKFEFWLE